MNFLPTGLPGSFIVELTPLIDHRGWFARTYSKEEFNNIGFQGDWVQINHSFTKEKGTIRGMHFQVFPYAEIKLIRCIAGHVYDVIIDLRQNSATFLKWTAVELTEDNKKMVYIPQGFAHGFQTLTDNCQLIYHHSQIYQHDYERGIRFNDPFIGIKWQLEASNLSPRDGNHPLLDSNFAGINF